MNSWQSRLQVSQASIISYLSCSYCHWPFLIDYQYLLSIADIRASAGSDSRTAKTSIWSTPKQSTFSTSCCGTTTRSGWPRERQWTIRISVRLYANLLDLYASFILIGLNETFSLTTKHLACCDLDCADYIVLFCNTMVASNQFPCALQIASLKSKVDWRRPQHPVIIRQRRGRRATPNSSKLEHMLVDIIPWNFMSDQQFKRSV